MGGIVRGVTKALGFGGGGGDGGMADAAAAQAAELKRNTDAQIAGQQENTRLMQQQLQQQAEASRNALQNSVAQQQAANEASQLQAEAAPDSKPVSVQVGDTGESDPRRRYFNQRSAASGVGGRDSGGVGIRLS